MSQFNMSSGAAVRSGTATVTKQDDSKLVWFDAPMPSADYTVVPHADGVSTTMTCDVVAKECFRVSMKPRVDAQIHWIAAG